VSYVVLLAMLFVAWKILRKRQSTGSPAWSPLGRIESKRFGNQAFEPISSEPPAHESPFGEDITNPDARIIPASLVGRWAMVDGQADDVLAIEPDTIVTPSGNERVVAVRFIGEEARLDTISNVAVVSRSAFGEYALRYFGLRSDDVLVDLESMDVVRKRVG
jgi:hypothetical protein